MIAWLFGIFRNIVEICFALNKISVKIWVTSVFSALDDSCHLRQVVFFCFHDNRLKIAKNTRRTIDKQACTTLYTFYNRFMHYFERLGELIHKRKSAFPNETESRPHRTLCLAYVLCQWHAASLLAMCKMLL